MYEDITKLDHTQLPNVDIYVCGFHCQSFSLMGILQAKTVTFKAFGGVYCGQNNS